MRDRVLLVLARDGLTRRPVAGSLFFYKGGSLYGRYWGASEQRRNLHFELCYYQGIEFAIERGLSLFEAGAQGEHKLARGFLPTLTYSAHEIRHPAFRRAIERYIAEERELLADTLAEYANHDPYRREAPERRAARSGFVRLSARALLRQAPLVSTLALRARLSARHLRLRLGRLVSFSVGEAPPPKVGRRKHRGRGVAEFADDAGHSPRECSEMLTSKQGRLRTTLLLDPAPSGEPVLDGVDVRLGGPDADVRVTHDARVGGAGWAVGSPEGVVCQLVQQTFPAAPRRSLSPPMRRRQRASSPAP